MNPTDRISYEDAKQRYRDFVAAILDLQRGWPPTDHGGPNDQAYVERHAEIVAWCFGGTGWTWEEVSERLDKERAACPTYPRVVSVFGAGIPKDAPIAPRRPGRRVS